MKNWTFVSSKAIWADSRITSEAKVIWHILMGFRNHKTGMANPTLWTLRHLSGWHRRKVDLAIKELELCGAITKRLTCIRKGNRIIGRECTYWIKPVSQGIGNELKCALVDSRGVEQSGEGHNNSNPVITVNQSITNKPSYRRLASAQPGFPNPQSPKPAFEQNEIEAFLDQRGFEPEIASITFDRMEADNWLDSAKMPFKDKATLGTYVTGLAHKIYAARSGTRF